MPNAVFYYMKFRQSHLTYEEIRAQKNERNCPYGTSNQWILFWAFLKKQNEKCIKNTCKEVCI